MKKYNEGLVGFYRDTIEYNEDLYKIFENLYKTYCSSIGISFDINMSKEIFTDIDKRLDFFYDKIFYLINENDNEEYANKLKQYVNLYFETESKLEKLEKKITDNFKMLDESINNFDKKEATQKDVENYFYCVYYAYKNYILKKYDEKFVFYSKEMQDSFFKNMFPSFSVENRQIWHLLGLPGIFKDITDCYNKFSDEKIDVHSFIFDDSSQRIIEALISKNMSNLSGLEKEVLNELLENMSIEKVYESLTKSFKKCINFSRMYEYKLIPEIIFNYQFHHDVEIVQENSELIEKDRNYGASLSTDAYTPIEKYKIQKIEDVDYDSLDTLNKTIIDEAKKQYGTEVEIGFDNRTNRISKIRVSDDEYKPALVNNKIVFNIDFPVNTLLVSYDKTQLIENQNEIDNLFLSVMYVLSLIIDELGINRQELIEKNINQENYYNISFKNIFTRSYLTIDEIKSLLSETVKNDIGDKYKKIFSKIDENSLKKNEIYKSLKSIVNGIYNSNQIINNLNSKLNVVIDDKVIRTDAIKISLFVPLMQMIDEKNLKERSNIKDIGVMGYMLKFNEDKDDLSEVNDSNVQINAVKTFAYKNESQLMGDLRAYGHSFMVDYISDDDGTLLKIPTFNKDISKILRENFNKKIDNIIDIIKENNPKKGK